MVLADDCHPSHVKRMRQLGPLRILPLDDLSRVVVLEEREEEGKSARAGVL